MFQRSVASTRTGVGIAGRRWYLPINRRTTTDEGWDKYYAGNEGRRIQRLQGFEAGEHSKTSGLGWTSTGKNHSGRGHAIRAHHSVGGIPTSQSTAGLGRRGSRRSGGGSGNGFSCRFACDVYGPVRRFRERNLQ